MLTRPRYIVCQKIGIKECVFFVPKKRVCFFFFFKRKECVVITFLK